jgi:predicted transposase/invertase (TIGR01784 family)
LRDKANFDILSGFLTELLCKPVSVQEILESEGNQGKPKGKTNRLDLKAKIDDGELAVFEIQYHDQMDFIGKVLFNACKAVVEQIPSGESYDVKKVYSVNIAYYGIRADKEYVFVASLTEFKGINFDETIPFSQNLDPLSRKVSKDIHPEYFLILPNNFKGKVKSRFDEWVYVLKNSSVKSEFTAAGVQEAGERLDVLKMTPEERAQYEWDKRADMDNKTQLLTAKIKGKEEGEAIGLEKGEVIGLEKGKAIGLEKGKAIGLEKGEAIGLEKGKELGREEERQKANAEKLEIAKKLLQKGVSIEEVSDFTGLPPQQISEIT